MSEKSFLPARTTIVTAIALLLPVTIAAQNSDAVVRADLPLSTADAQALFEELSGEIAMQHVREIAQYHRIQASPMMGESAVYVQQQLLRYGSRLPFP